VQVKPKPVATVASSVKLRPHPPPSLSHCLICEIYVFASGFARIATSDISLLKFFELPPPSCIYATSRHDNCVLACTSLWDLTPSSSVCSILFVSAGWLQDCPNRNSLRHSLSFASRRLFRLHASRLQTHHHHCPARRSRSLALRATQPKSALQPNS
jgi:hypothetical protein